jgi:hypothetical protein
MTRDLDNLLDTLAADGAPAGTGHAARFYAPLAGILLLSGLALSLILDGAFKSTALYGMGPIAVKWGFSLALLLLTAAALFVLGRPGRPSGLSMVILAIPFVPMIALLAYEISIIDFVVEGATWRSCLAAMTIISPIGFAAAIVAVRSLAPVKLREAGLAAGLFGGAVAMTAYSPFCPELGMGYLAMFYMLPILAMAAIGWLAGPRLLRW